jgi:cbb3-type cytochrome oxidase subunit 3
MLHATPTASTAAPARDADGFPVVDVSGLETLETTHFRIFYEPEAAAGARSLAADAEGRRAWIYDELGLEDERPMRLFLLTDLNDYFLRGGGAPRAPDWAIGLSLGNEGTVLVKWGRGSSGGWLDLERTFVHELAHLSLDRATGVGSDNVDGAEATVGPSSTGDRKVPRWLHEGFAIHQAGEWTLERSASLLRAGLTGNIIPLTELHRSFPSGGFAVELAYAESYHFLLRLFDLYGRDKFKMFIAALRHTSFEDAFARTYLVSFRQAESDWREDLNVSYTWVPVVFGSTTLWFFVALLAVWAYRRKRRHILDQMAEMDDGQATAAPQVPLPGLGLTRAHIEGATRARGTFTIDPRAHQAPPEDDDNIPRSADGYTLH